ncbi:MAG: GIY-YIG nuclease family protein [Opitutales bacterium]|nr:GIY-YIG nuclease family protein [Opitutales bacterium]
MIKSLYILKGTTGRYYIGSTENVDKRLHRHNSGSVHSTKRIGIPLKLVAIQEFSTTQDARKAERKYKSWKNPKKVIETMLNA